jgi:hypothetical protein
LRGAPCRQCGYPEFDPRQSSLGFCQQADPARSIPDYQECASRQFEMFTKDSRRLLANSQKLIETATRFFSGQQF